MKQPPFLKPGDLIAIIAPAGKVNEAQILPAILWLEGEGFRIAPGIHLFGQHFQYSGTDEERLGDLQSALDDPEVKAVFCARGGYGMSRITEKLDFRKFVNYPKWLVGFSDITLLHNAIHSLKICSVHGIMPRSILNMEGKPTESVLLLIAMLKGETCTYQFAENQMNRRGKAIGRLAGGNLSILYSLLGTPFDIETQGKILFIEEIGEYLYHTDRMMRSLKMAGKLENLAGLVVGQFSDVKDNDDPFGQTVEEIINEAVAGTSYPVCFGFQAGHDEPNYPLMLGQKWKLKVTNTGVEFGIA